ncbi:hypothetical protein ACQ4PT_045485 [Festuca glaucescens]
MDAINPPSLSGQAVPRGPAATTASGSSVAAAATTEGAVVAAPPAAAAAGKRKLLGQHVVPAPPAGPALPAAVAPAVPAKRVKRPSSKVAAAAPAPKKAARKKAAKKPPAAKMASLTALTSELVPAMTEPADARKALAYTIAHVAQYNNAVVSVTEKVLSARNLEIPVRKLRVGLYFRREEYLSIGRVVASTMATQTVDDVEFGLLTEKSFPKCADNDLLWYAKQFNTWLGDCPAVFAGLTRLWLRNMRFGELDIPNILSTCNRLVYLRLSCCDAGVRSVLQLEHVQLVELHIDHGQIEAVQLNCLPKLQRVNYVGWSSQDPLMFGSVPQFSKLRLENMGISSTQNLQLSQLLANAPSISDLHLDFGSDKIWILAECRKLLAPVLGNLQIVNLVNLPEGCDIAWTMFIIEAAPALKELCLRLLDHWCKYYRRKSGVKANVEWQQSAVDFKHKNLVKLAIYGFQPDENFLRYVRRIMEVAVNVGEISLHDREVCEGCWNLDPEINVCPSRYPLTGEEKNMLREKIARS